MSYKRRAPSIPQENIRPGLPVLVWFDETTRTEPSWLEMAKLRGSGVELGVGGRSRVGERFLVCGFWAVGLGSCWDGV